MTLTTNNNDPNPRTHPVIVIIQIMCYGAFGWLVYELYKLTVGV